MADAAFGAIELGGSKVLCAVGTPDAIRAEVRIPTTQPGDTLAAVERFFAPHRAAISAIGVAAFGPLELSPGPRFGALLRTPKPGWTGVPIAARLADALRLPVAIDTDVNAAVLAEQRLGAGEGEDPCVYVTVGTGIGVGVSIAGRPIHGLMHPELGHLPAPPLCDFPGICPFHGRCIEGVASAPAIAARAGTATEQLPDDHPVWALEARYLAHVLAASVLAYAPRRIVVGGGVLARTGLRAMVRAALVDTVAGYLPRPELTHEGVTAYVRAPRFENAGLIGAFLLAQGASSAN